MTKKLTDDVSEKIIDDRIDKRLVITKYYLKKILGKFDLDGGWGHFYFTTHLDSFTFFGSNAIEVVTREINKAFSLISDENKVSIYNVKGKLNSNIENQKKIKQIISNYFTNPYDGNTMDYSNSSLWSLRELRNIIAHGKTLIRTVSNTPSYYGFIIPYPMLVKVKKKWTTVGIHRLQILDSDEYFTNLYENLETFCDSIREIIPQKYQSSQHKNRLDFEL